MRVAEIVKITLLFKLFFSMLSTFIYLKNEVIFFNITFTEKKYMFLK